MGIEFKALSQSEQEKLGKALRDNAESGTALRMGKTTEWHEDEELTDDEVISAIRSVPCHYATITPCQVGWLRTLITEHHNVMQDAEDDDPSATAEMLREVQSVYDALVAEVARNGSPTDPVGTIMADERYDVLLFPHDDYDRTASWTTDVYPDEVADETALRR